ncbi:hypothetical protein [Aquicella lusitana]|uniref:Uncharacterized protein n=1 Tax=Aquicella lusitana TaxID=254246 RepID=A0A370GWV4_9COXI|nr:hypothetical protein [Aquicella lusitana]RDI48132.1 hypothetical protein C8D86_10397 [Aquicella lusitana]VVC72852.1 hypothetical protein AQULUS_05760 [Aquicella lusitana]
MKSNNLIAIYDFEFFPYALGDVLTWNVRTAMRCEETGKSSVDVYICLDKEHPASIYQRGLINPDNFELFFNELYGAFGTNPRLGNIYIFRQRDAMLETLEEIAAKADEHNLEAINDYLAMLKDKVSDGLLRKAYNIIEQKIRRNALMKKIIQRVVPEQIQKTVGNSLSDEKRLNDYFIKYVYSHESINQFAAQKGYIPFLQPSLGCGPDIDEVIARQFKGKKIVPFHLRLRRLDVGYGGDHTYTRDSDFLEWYDFLREAGTKHPEVQFVVLGRLQEKPLEILRLPNVTSLRIYGMGLGHELTLMLKSDLFIGTSSGFAALANFSAIPYFITKMNPGSCHAYAIPEGAEKLPFANENQKLVYEKETSKLLMTLLEAGLELKETVPSAENTSISQEINIENWLKLHTNPFHSSRTTSRFYKDEKYRNEETAYLLLPYLEKAREAVENNEPETAQAILLKLKNNFSDLCNRLPEYLSLEKRIMQKAEEAFE